MTRATGTSSRSTSRSTGGWGGGVDDPAHPETLVVTHSHLHQLRCLHGSVCGAAYVPQLISCLANKREAGRASALAGGPIPP